MTVPSRGVFELWYSNIPLNDVFVFPPNFVTQSTNGAVLPSRFQPQYSQCLRYDHALLLVIRWGDTLEHL